MQEDELHRSNNCRYNCLQPYYYKNERVPINTVTSDELSNCLPPITISREMSERKTIGDSTRNYYNSHWSNARYEIKPNSLKKANVLKSQNDESTSACEKSGHVTEMSTNWKLLHSKNVTWHPSVDATTPLLNITTMTFNKVTDRHPIKIPANIRSQSMYLSKPSVNIPTIKCDYAKEIVHHSNVDERERNRSNVNSKLFTNTEERTYGPKTPPSYQHGVTSRKVSVGNEQSNDIQAALYSSLHAKSIFSKTEIKTGCLQNKSVQKSEINKLGYSHLDRNKNSQATTSCQSNVCNKQQNQATSGCIKDYPNEKVKPQTDKRVSKPKTVYSCVEGNRIAISEDTNVEKFIDAISFHRWKNKSHSSESDYQLLAERVLVPMGATFVEKKEENKKKTPNRQFSERKQSKDNISLLLETCKKNRKRLPCSLGMPKRNRKFKPFLVKKDKTEKQNNKTVKQKDKTEIQKNRHVKRQVNSKTE